MKYTSYENVRDDIPQPDGKDTSLEMWLSFIVIIIIYRNSKIPISGATRIRISAVLIKSTPAPPGCAPDSHCFMINYGILSCPRPRQSFFHCCGELKLIAKIVYISWRYFEFPSILVVIFSVRLPQCPHMIPHHGKTHWKMWNGKICFKGYYLIFYKQFIRSSLKFIINHSHQSNWFSFSQFYSVRQCSTYVLLERMGIK